MRYDCFKGIPVNLKSFGGHGRVVRPGPSRIIHSEYADADLSAMYEIARPTSNRRALAVCRSRYNFPSFVECGLFFGRDE